jgi:hypothetical protein
MVVNVSYKSPHTVKTEEGEIISDNVIVATQLPFLNRSLHFSKVTPSSDYCVALKLKDNSKLPKQSYINQGFFYKNKN